MPKKKVYSNPKASRPVHLVAVNKLNLTKTNCEVKKKKKKRNGIKAPSRTGCWNHVGTATQRPPSLSPGLFPAESGEFDNMKTAFERLSLNDAALFYEPENSVSWLTKRLITKLQPCVLNCNGVE